MELPEALGAARPNNRQMRDAHRRQHFPVVELLSGEHDAAAHFPVAVRYSARISAHTRS